jgi:hypothetical protein
MLEIRILAGTGVGKEVVITSNDANTLTITNPGFVPDTTTKYIIMDTFCCNRRNIYNTY